MTITETPLDPEHIGAVAQQLSSIYTGAMLTYMVDLGHRTGLWATLAGGPGTSSELAARANLTERYVREWLSAVATGGLVDYDAATDTFSLSPVRAAMLTDGPMNMAPIAALCTHVGKHVHQVARAFREGGGVPYSEYRPEFTDAMEAVSRPAFDGMLVDVYLPLVPGLRERLEAGARVADVGCGTGHSLVVLGRAFPASTFVGYDLDDNALARGRAEASGAGLDNVTYKVADAARLEADEPFDAVFVFDAIHDQVDPAGVLARISANLVPGGVFMMKEPHAADTLAENFANPMAPVQFAVSTLHCMPVSLAHGGAGIGTAFGEGLARQMLADAGFVDIAVHPAPADPMNAIYVAHAPSK